MKVYFVGAGPGDPKLLTIKGKEIIEKCEVIIYAGSLVNKEILSYAVNAKKIVDSALIDLQEIKELFIAAVKSNSNVARIHSGDSSIYGSINEQTIVLDELKIDYEVIPGVSSFQATAAALCQELTIPEVCQTITLSRVKGRTPVPEKEDLEKLIKTRPTLILFLSITKLNEIVETLKTEYSHDTPIVVAYKVSWPEEKIIIGNLNNIMEKTAEENFNMSALIIVGDVLKKMKKKSCLYDNKFSHFFRSATTQET